MTGGLPPKDHHPERASLVRLHLLYVKRPRFDVDVASCCRPKGLRWIGRREFISLSYTLGQLPVHGLAIHPGREIRAPNTHTRTQTPRPSRCVRALKIENAREMRKEKRTFLGSIVQIRPPTYPFC